MDNIRSDKPEVLVPQILIDGELVKEDLNISLLKELERMAPFGHKNPSPVFCIREVRISELRYMGENKQHVSFFSQGVEFILFNKSDEYKEVLNGGCKADIAGVVGISRWNDKEKIQFVIKDIQ